MGPLLAPASGDRRLVAQAAQRKRKKAIRILCVTGRFTERNGAYLSNTEGRSLKRGERERSCTMALWKITVDNGQEANAFRSEALGEYNKG